MSETHKPPPVAPSPPSSPPQPPCRTLARSATHAVAARVACFPLAGRPREGAARGGLPREKREAMAWAASPTAAELASASPRKRSSSSTCCSISAMSPDMSPSDILRRRKRPPRAPRRLALDARGRAVAPLGLGESEPAELAGLCGETGPAAREDRRAAKTGDSSGRSGRRCACCPAGWAYTLPCTSHGSSSCVGVGGASPIMLPRRHLRLSPKTEPRRGISFRLLPCAHRSGHRLG